MLSNHSLQPKTVIIRRRQNQGFGFTLRHFIAYPPETWPNTSDLCQRKAMETIFIKEVHPNGPAHVAGLETGDRVLMVNNVSVAGISYSAIVSMIKQTPTVLKLQVVPKECDILQMYYTDIAHNPESNRQTVDIIRPQIPITSATNNTHNNFHSRLISYSPEGFPTVNSTSIHPQTSHLPKTIQSFGNNEVFVEGCQMRSKQSNLSVLQKPNNDDLMVRLRKSIEQKEEFLKSPAPNSQTSFLYQQNLAGTSSASSTRNMNSIIKHGNELIVASNAINSINNSNSSSGNSGASYIGSQSGFYRNSNQFSSPIPGKFIVTRSSNSPIEFGNHFLNSNDMNSLTSSTSSMNRKQLNSVVTVAASRNFNNQHSNNISSNNTSSGNSTINKFHKELEFLETLPEMGVTNQVFERKLVSNLAKGFDPFKQLSINTAINSIAPCIDDKAIVKLDSRRFQNFELVDYQNIKRNEIAKLSLDAPKQDDSSPENSENIDELQSLQKPYEVVRRLKSNGNDENKPMRRISYLRATNSELNDYQIEVASDFLAVQKEIEYEQEKLQNIRKQEQHLSIVQTETNRKSEILEKEEPEFNGTIDTKSIKDFFETEMEIKSSCIYGKRLSEYRSWRQSKIELNGDILKIFPIRSSKSDNNVIELNVKHFKILDETIDKKKYVFRLQSKSHIELEIPQEQSTSATEVTGTTTTSMTLINEYTNILFKTKSITEMKKLFGLLQEKCETEDNSHGKQLAEPQKIVATSSVSTYCEETSNASVQTKEYSPLLSSKSSTPGGGNNGRIESELIPDSISPLMKSRKPSNSKTLADKDLGSPKAKNWKDLLFRRIHNNSGNAEVSSTTTTSSGGISPRLVGSIGVPLKSCPMSKDNEFVPNIVEVCTNIVETKGLNVIGIYRIPGNKAAISELKEQVNKPDFTWDKIDNDVRWEDVNVVSSLLKLFIRSLPDALLPGSFYINFIEADKKTTDRRLKELKHLMQALPTYSYETMKHLIRHLNRVSKNCEINLMEPKNLAIIFGPSIIRTTNETLEIAVKDMKHQCRIVELLVTQYDYFFENGDFPELEPSSPQIIISSSQQDQTTLLLDNVSKIEQRLQDKESLTSRFIPHLRRRTHSKRSAISSDTYSGESVLSLEYKKFPEAPMKENIVHSSSSSSTSKKLERSSVEISILLTDEDSSNSRLSDTGSMSLTTITDTLDSKLRNLRSGSESTDDTTDNSPNKTRRTFPQPLILHENIPYADESPERHLITSTSSGVISNDGALKNLPISARSANFIRDITKNIASINSRFSSVYESCSDDSEVSTTSDPKEAIVISPLFLERYKKRRDYRLFRSASFNCRNYSSSRGTNGQSNSSSANASNLTKDEKTDMNLTKKRQIQNKQNRSIKRRHTVGGPHDYSTTTVTRRNLNSNENHILEVGIRIKNVNRRN